LAAIEATSGHGMMKRLFDALLALCALVAVSPLLLVAAVGIRLTTKGPILYRARRTGYRGREFTLYKLRTMRVDASSTAGPITARNDSRVFPFGAWLRATKVDELPQLVNVLRGEMAIVGPRPEAPEMVRRYYTTDDLETLQVLPGLTSPGSLYYYTHCESALASDDVTRLYAEQLLPRKLAMDRVYIANATFLYDVRVMLRTIAVIAARGLGRRQFPEPPEMAQIHLRPDAPTVRWTP